MRSVTPPTYLLRLLSGLTATLALLALTTAVARAACDLDIHGGGDGHGIGMSQYGAEGYALHGATYQAILAHYFQGTALGHAPVRAGAFRAGAPAPGRYRIADGSFPGPAVTDR